MTKVKKRKKILVIDDDQSIAQVLKEYLEAKEYDVTFVTKVTDLDVLILSERPDLIFLDYRMSPLTGKDILEHLVIKAHLIPVIMMSAYRTREGTYEVQNLGAMEYISKPFDFNEIENILQKIFTS